MADPLGDGFTVVDDIWRDVTVLNRFKTGRKLVSQFIHPLTGVMLGIGMVLSGVPNLPVQASEQVISSASMSSIRPNAAIAARPDRSRMNLGQLYSEAVSGQASAFPANGIYLYGQSPQPEQVGAAYAVMEIVDNRAVGAFYMPQSSFDCFYGSVESDNLNLNVVSSYDQVTHEYSVAFQAGTAIATTNEAAAPVQLVGYHPIDTVSNNDHRILGMCRANLAGQI